MAELEENEEAGCYTAKKKEAHMYHHSMMPCSWQIREASHGPLFVVHSPLWVVYTPLIGGRSFR
jgi:phosphatidylserine decarboxylase